MSKWEEDSSFELPEDESWRGDVHAPQDISGTALPTWIPGMTHNDADDLFDDIFSNDEEEDFDAEDATDEELEKACKPIASGLSNETFLVAYLLYLEQDSIGEISEALEIPPRKARLLRDNLIELICARVEEVCPKKIIDMEIALSVIYSAGMNISCKQCGDLHLRFARYCTSCGNHNPDFNDELFLTFWGHSIAVEAEHGCPKTHAEAVEAHASGFCMICGTHFPPKPQSPD